MEVRSRRHRENCLISVVTGTLDPLATGVLVIGVGKGCKMLSTYLKGTKEYKGVGLLGVETDTLDSEGAGVKEMPWQHVTIDQLDCALPHFQGSILQTPPMYSALKKNGKPLYKLARAGQTVERPKRKVHVKRIELLAEIDGRKIDLPEFGVEVEVSGGTYIRTLIADIATHCGSCAHMTSLVRTRVGPFGLDDCIQQEQWKSEGDIMSHVQHCTHTILSQTKPTLATSFA